MHPDSQFAEPCLVAVAAGPNELLRDLVDFGQLGRGDASTTISYAGISRASTRNPCSSLSFCESQRTIAPRYVLRVGLVYSPCGLNRHSPGANPIHDERLETWGTGFRLRNDGQLVAGDGAARVVAPDEGWDPLVRGQVKRGSSSVLRPPRRSSDSSACAQSRSGTTPVIKGSS